MGLKVRAAGVVGLGVGGMTCGRIRDANCPRARALTNKVLFCLCLVFVLVLKAENFNAPSPSLAVVILNSAC